jgi:protein TonB
MLFTDAAKPVQPQAPQTSAPGAVPDPKFVTTDLDSFVRDLTQDNLATTPAPPKPVTSLKIVPPLVKPIATSLDAEEVQIPSWLAPLARNAEADSAHSETSAATAEAPSIASQDTAAREESASTEHTPSLQSEIFGGGILTDSLDSPAPAESGSKTGLFIGLAAAAALVLGGYWYSQQPGNMLTSRSSSKPAVTASVVAQPAPSAVNPSADVVAPASSAPAKSNIAPPPAAPAPNTERDRAVSSSVSPARNSSSRASQPVEEPQAKKPTLGDVRLSNPVVNRSGSTQEISAGDPGVVAAPVATGSDPLASLAAHDRGPSAPLPVGGDVKPATLIKSVPPVYPQLARAQHVSGNVQIDALIDKDGNVATAKALSGPPLLHDAALEAVKQWKYSPAKLDGNATSMHLTITVQFRAQ